MIFKLFVGFESKIWTSPATRMEIYRMIIESKDMPIDVSDVERSELEDKINQYLVDNWGAAYTVDEIMDHLKSFNDEPWCEFMKTQLAKSIVTSKLEEMVKRTKIQTKDEIDDRTGHEERYYYVPDMSPLNLDL